MFFILFVIMLFLGSFLVDGYILFRVAKRYTLDNLSFTQSLFILILISIVGAASDILLQLGKLHFLTYVVALLAMFYAFHWYFKKKYHIDWKKSLHAFLIFAALTTFISILVIVPTRLYLFEPFIVKGDAMQPTYKTGDYLLIGKWDKKFSRGDIVIIRRGEPNAFVIKRIIGLPFEKIEIMSGSILINGQKLNETYRRGETADNLSLALSKNEYFVLNDNREWSGDSRTFGPITKSDVVGTVLLELPKFLKEQELWSEKAGIR